MQPKKPIPKESLEKEQSGRMPIAALILALGVKRKKKSQ
jgi:hypothetical protein